MKSVPSSEMACLALLLLLVQSTSSLPEVIKLGETLSEETHIFCQLAGRNAGDDQSVFSDTENLLGEQLSDFILFFTVKKKLHSPCSLLRQVIHHNEGFRRRMLLKLFANRNSHSSACHKK